MGAREYSRGGGVSTLGVGVCKYSQGWGCKYSGGGGV